MHPAHAAIGLSRSPGLFQFILEEDLVNKLPNHPISIPEEPMTVTKLAWMESELGRPAFYIAYSMSLAMGRAHRLFPIETGHTVKLSMFQL